MKILLLTLGLGLVCGLQGLDNSAKGSPKLDGKWFTVALASNVTSKIEEGGSLRIFVYNIRVYDGFLTADFFKRENGKCIPFSVTAITKEDGSNLVHYDGLNDFSLESFDDEYSIFMLYNIKDGEVTIWGELFGRTPDLPDEIKKKFEEICERFGIGKDQIRDLYNDG
ncbi:major urinary protein-like [Phascolarctos cinereus]